MSESENSLLESAKALIESANRLKEDVQALQDVHGQTLDGSGKLCRKIESEIKFLTQVWIFENRSSYQFDDYKSHSI